MNKLSPAWYAQPKRVDLFGVPEGFDALMLARAAAALADQSRPILHVARDDARAQALADALAVFAPEAEVIQIPGWDCLPYDRVSPHADVVARRLDTLGLLAAQPRTSRPRIVIATVSALTQRVPPRAMLAASQRRVALGDTVDIDDLIAFFVGNGYRRADTVREAGEFAQRGGILDVFPPGVGEPLRLDFFGDGLDNIRTFDALSQRSTGTLDAVVFKPVSEVLLSEAAIDRFRAGYRALFGAETGSDPLYEAVSAGRRPIGVEHWLPLFHERLETLFDYLPDAAISVDHQGEQAIRSRLDQIAEYFEARRTLQRAASREGAPYNPLSPDRLYLTAEELVIGQTGRPVALFNPSQPPEKAGYLDAGGRFGRDFGDIRAQQSANLFQAVREHVTGLVKDGVRAVICAHSAGARERLKGLLRENGLDRTESVADSRAVKDLPAGMTALLVLNLARGFRADGFAVIAEGDILGDRLIRSTKRKRANNFLTEVATLEPGDLVVHVDHGIGRYEGLETLDIGNAPHDCLSVSYAGGDKLYVPVENIEVLSRFGADEGATQLDKLGGVAWQARKSRVRQRLRDMAGKLIETAAARQVADGDVLTVPSGAYDEFAARFPYAETDDQLRAIEDTLADLSSGKATDRLICGDVGFGKTEVAMRAAFVAAMAGVQVAVVVPTTLLARQHYRNFSERFRGLPVRVEQLSRLVAPKQASHIKKDLAEGKIDIIVGTHALLSKSIGFRELGLLIVDEEQHFGVAQKERLKELRSNIHVLTLTATPIPRTLQLALSGVREMSIIATPPVDRLAVRTFVLPFDPVVVREAILREHFRGGQIFYVCPRIEDLDEVAARIRALVPEIRIAIAHGRMAATQLEDVMNAFTDGGYDLLLSTNIVESGLDIPSANTMIVHRADMFGLAQLYQLRGRIGRSKLRAYAYLTLPPEKTLTPTALKRLEVMQTLDQLGAGFQLASHDLDIRGAGNLLGEEQSGHIREVGIELYQQMLEEAVASAREGGALKDEAPPEAWTPQITMGTPVLIPESYVGDLTVRLSLYRRISGLLDRAEIDGFAAEMIDRFGPLPPEVENLLAIIQIKRLCRDAGVEKLDAGPKGAVLVFHRNVFTNPPALVDFIRKQPAAVKLRPDHKLVFMQDWEQPNARIKGVRGLMEQLAKLAA